MESGPSADRDTVMWFRVQIEACEDHLRATARGRTSVGGMKRLAEAIRAESVRTGLRGAVIDCAGLSGSLNLPDLFEVGNYYAGALQGVRLAGINMPAAWRNNRFSEDVVSNRGGRLRHFDSEAEAVLWASRKDEPASGAGGGKN